MSEMPGAGWRTARDRFGPCAKPDCLRKVSPASRYCCVYCGRADEGGYECGSLADGDHPLISHSVGCDRRRAERGEWTVWTKPEVSPGG